jgi:hypothetical protein
MAMTQSAPLRARFATGLTALLHAITRKLSSHPKGSIAAFGIFFAVAIVVVFLADLRARYRAEVNLAAHSAQNYAEVLAEHTALTFEAVDRSLRQAQLIRADLMAALAVPGADAALLRRRANEALNHLQQTSQVLVAIVWTNKNGDIEDYSQERGPSLSNIANVAHFAAHRDSQDDRLYISRPFHGFATNRWLIAVSRRLANPDGSFAGVVVALLDQAYFLGIYRSIDVGPHGAVAMLDRDGFIFARQPPIDPGNPAGSRWPNVKHLLTAETGSYETVNLLDQSPRIVGYKAVSVPPVIVVVSYHRDDRLAAWYQHLY